MTLQDREQITMTYSEPLSLEDVRQILHISKRKASWLLQNGYILCENTGKQTRQYKITFNGLFEYMTSIEKGDVTLYLPIGLFNAHSTKKKSRLTPREYIIKPPSEFREWLTLKWQDKPDALTQNKVVKLTGYHKNTVQKWVYKKRLKAVQLTYNMFVVPKEWLIEFYCEKAYVIQRKSKKHLILLGEYYS